MLLTCFLRTKIGKKETQFVCKKWKKNLLVWETFLFRRWSLLVLSLVLEEFFSFSGWLYIFLFAVDIMSVPLELCLPWLPRHSCGSTRKNFWGDFRVIIVVAQITTNYYKNMIKKVFLLDSTFSYSLRYIYFLSVEILCVCALLNGVSWYQRDIIIDMVVIISFAHFFLLLFIFFCFLPCFKKCYLHRYEHHQLREKKVYFGLIWSWLHFFSFFSAF